MTGAAVDEGRNPYGTPGRGNGDRLWRLLLTVPCRCGARAKRLTIKRGDATVTCQCPSR